MQPTARAEEDRRAFLAQQLDERHYEQRMADARWRLDLLLSIAAEFEPTQPEAGPFGGSASVLEEVRILVRAYPGPLPVFRKEYVEGRPAGMTKGSDWLAELRAVAEQYGPLPAASSEDGLYFQERAVLLRLELARRTTEVRRELLSPPA